MIHELINWESRHIKNNPSFVIKQLERSPNTKTREFGRRDERELDTYDHVNQTDLKRALRAHCLGKSRSRSKNAVRSQDTPRGASIDRLLVMEDDEKIAEAEQSRCYKSDRIGAAAICRLFLR